MKSLDIEDLHQKIKDRSGLRFDIIQYPDLNIAEWTKCSRTLLHAAAKADNLGAMDHLIKNVNILSVSDPKLKAKTAKPLTFMQDLSFHSHTIYLSVIS